MFDSYDSGNVITVMYQIIFNCIKHLQARSSKQDNRYDIIFFSLKITLPVA